MVPINMAKQSKHFHNVAENTIASVALANYVAVAVTRRRGGYGEGRGQPLPESKKSTNSLNDKGKTAN